ncbi:MAG: hypothetical protein ACLR5N_06305 [Haemophilus parainfluenzae]
MLQDATGAKGDTGATGDTGAAGAKGDKQATKAQLALTGDNWC